ncbi:integrase [Ancylobacter sp. 3268]|uniref:tyrosine-type recombinase/integrase n=1 Tax=Ancylobacter sp. 3268 TaxID=2817752 RepID=UPI0028593D4E|nr:tyrosine-type recombinase/integrase [Ancylobacter sp. 3268]MDR6954877.1 integrase [Ancylobacter sp. 3268]
MGSARISKRIVDALVPGAVDQYVWDTELPGFGIRVRPSGAATYIITYRVGSGRRASKKRLVISVVGKCTPDEARKIARQKLALVVTGGDPAADRARKRADLTVAELCDRYLEEGCALKKASTVEADKSRVHAHIKPLLGKKLIGEIDRSDLERFMRDVADGRTRRSELIRPGVRSVVRGGKGTATRTLRQIGGMFSWAVRQRLMPSNPAAGLEKFPDRKSERFLSSSELAALGAALREAETTGVPWRIDAAKSGVKHVAKRRQSTVSDAYAVAAIRLLLLTGCRLGEILNLRWAEIDFERGLLLLPDSKTGRKSVILNAPAVVMLSELPRIGIYVIASSSAGLPGEKPRADLKRPWAAVSRRAGLEGVRLHDLRHTHASIGAGAGLGLPVIGKLLGHTQPSTTARYAHVDNDPLRKASNAIANRIAAAMGEGSDEPGADVILLPATKVHR